jgi:hypothetical protein
VIATPSFDHGRLRDNFEGPQHSLDFRLRRARFDRSSSRVRNGVRRGYLIPSAHPSIAKLARERFKCAQKRKT